MKKFIFGLTAAVALCASVNTAKAEVEVAGSVDLVTSTVWRGAAAAAGPSLQPAATVSAAGFELTGWASQTFDDTYSELDFTLSYGIGGLTVAYTNYWWTGLSVNNLDLYDADGNVSYNYFTKGSHFSEVTLAYEFGESFPLSISWNTMVSGNQDLNGLYSDSDSAVSQNYSTYIEVAYPFAVSSVDCSASVGVTPWTGMYSGDTTGFEVASIALSASKDLLDSDKFSLPLYVTATFGPTTNNAYLVAGLSFGF